MNNAESLLAKMREYFPNFKCNLQDLRNPTEEFVTNFYTFFLQEFEVDVSNLHHIQLQQNNVLGVYSDSQSAFIFKGNLLNCLRAFDIIPDIGMMDIHSPTPNRIQHILRAFIEFYTLADEGLSSLNDKSKIVKERKMKMMTMVKKKEELKKHLNDIVTNLANLQLEEKQLEEHISKLQQIAPELKTKKQLAKRVIDLAKEKLNEKERILQKVNKEIAMVTDKMKETTGMIVDSPLSFLCDVDSQREKAKELEDLAEQKQSLLEEKTQKDLKLQTYLSLLQDKIQVSNEVFKIFKLLKEDSKVVSDIERNIKASQEKLDELSSSLLSLSNKKQMQQEMLQDSHLQWKTLEPQLTQNVASCVRELNKKKDAKNKMISSLKEDATLEEKKNELCNDLKKSLEQFAKDDQTWRNMQNQYFEELEKRQDADNNNLLKVKEDVEKSIKSEQDTEAKGNAKPRKSKKDKR